MAVVDVYPDWRGEQVGLRQLPGVDNWEGNASLNYTVLVDDPTDGADTVLAAASIPDIGDAHADYSDLKVVHQLPGRIGPTLWGVNIQWAGANDPLNQPYDRRYQSSNVVEAINSDSAGDLIANSAGGPFNGITADIADLVYVVTRNEATFPLATTRTYLNSVSSDTYKGYAIGEAYMRNISGVYVPQGGGNYYYRVTYEIVFRVGGWGVRVLNKGPRYKVSPAGATASVRDRLGADEGRLDSDGTLLDDGDADVWLTFDVYDDNNFTSLGLG